MLQGYLPLATLLLDEMPSLSVLSCPAAITGVAWQFCHASLSGSWGSLSLNRYITTHTHTHIRTLIEHAEIYHI